MYYPDGQDWFKNKLFSLNKWLCISGHYSFAEKMGLTADEIVSLLFIANRDRIYTYLLTIGIDLEREDEVKGILRLGGEYHYAYEIKARIEKIFGGEVHIILFAKDNDERENEYFSVSENFKEYKDLNSEGLIDYFRDIDGRIVHQPGTITAVNEQVLDAFHVWSREHLGQYICKGVINVFDLEDIADDNDREKLQPTIIKLRRFDRRDQYELENFKPYMRESSNFACHNLICSTRDIRLRTLVYKPEGEPEREDRVFLHDLFDPGKEVMHGRDVQRRPDDYEGIKNGVFSNTEDVREYTVP